MLLLTIAIITVVVSVVFHNCFLMKAVEECPFPISTMTQEEAKSEREYALVRASFYI